MSTKLKREEFDILVPGKKGGGEGQSAPPGVKPINSDKDQEKDGKGDGDSKGGGEDQKGQSGGSGKEGPEAKVSKIEKGSKGGGGSEDLSGRGIGGILTKEESTKIQKEMGVPVLTPPSEEEVMEKVRDLEPLLNQGAASQGRGHSGERLLPNVIAKLVRPIVNWKDQLKKFIGKVLGSKTEAIMPNRRFVSSGSYIYGSRKAEHKLKKCAIAVDTSGSMGGKELEVMINEIKGIAQAKKIKEFVIIYFDDGISNVVGLSSEQVKTYTPGKQRTGGTDFTEAIEFIDNIYKKGDLDLAVFMTDGYANLNLATPKCKEKFIWMILDNASFKAPFGNKVIHIEVKNGKAV